MSLVRPITRRDIKGPALYGPIRDDHRRRVIELKRPRRIVIGDRVSLVFENRHTLVNQSDSARAALDAPGTPIAVEIDHPNYHHRVACPEATRASLAADYA